MSMPEVNRDQAFTLPFKLTLAAQAAAALVFGLAHCWSPPRTFNDLGAVSAWVAVVGGNGGWLAPVVAAAASSFTIALIWVDRMYRD